MGLYTFYFTPDAMEGGICLCLLCPQDTCVIL